MNMVAEQLDMGWNQGFLDKHIEEAKGVIEACALNSKPPLIVQFSGGRDSMVLLDLVRQVTDRFACGYMATGTELPGVVTFVRKFCKDEGIQLLVSHPGLHKGNIFKRIDQFKSFPNLGSFEGGGKRLWCCRDLKLRPQKKQLNAVFGKGTFYRLEGIRRFESDRRKVIYRAYATTFMRPDDELQGSFEVYPILNFSNDDILRYIEQKKLPTLSLYKEFGVSGCSWCPFYDSGLYYGIMKQMPNWYDRFIAKEIELNLPSVVGGVWLRDIKQAVLEGKPPPEPRKSCKPPCTMEFHGERVHTCEVYGHLWLNGSCYRCSIKQEVK
jgi:phosphoadenosine phosphosulfate reductase